MSLSINLKDHQDKEQPCYIIPCPMCKSELEIYHWQIHKGPIPGVVFCKECRNQIAIEDN